jgi:hypothetical protein
MFCLEADIEADVNIIHEWIKNRILKRQLGLGCPRSGLCGLIRGFTVASFARFAGLYVALPSPASPALRAYTWLYRRQLRPLCGLIRGFTVASFARFAGLYVA